MCGINGFNFKNKKLISQMNSTASHRGPDNSDIFVDNNVSLGHLRLSIVDLSPLGHQPMFDSLKEICLIYNGEIFNFQELREELINDYEFKSKTDSEVLIYGYKKWGFEKLLSKLNGFFAFCIYDMKLKKLFLARDRLGKKPLYYYNEDDKFIFSSEIKSILDHNIKFDVNPKAVVEYFSLRYIPGKHSIFSNINRTLSGEMLVFDLEDKTLQKKKYWSIKNRKKYDKFKLRNLFKDSVQKRLIADVPVGVFLSGGFDSSAVLSYTNEHSKDLYSYSLGFVDDEIENELSLAKETSNYFKTKHKEVLISEDDVFENLAKIIYHLDEPMDDPASIANYFLFQEARKDVKVILTGDGADECFGGYSQYAFFLLGRKVSYLPKSILKQSKFFFDLVPKHILDKVYPLASVTGSKMGERFSKFLVLQKENPSEAFLEIMSIFDYDERKYLLKGSKLNKFNLKLGPIISKYKNSKDDLINLSNYDIENYLVEDLMMKPDKMGMAHGVEARAPFLDYRIVELSRNLKHSENIKKFSKKRFLRKELSKEMPNFLFNRSKKTFQMPIHSWIMGKRKDSIKKLIYEIVEEFELNKNYVDFIYKNYNKSKLFYSRQLWNLLVFAIWYKLFIKKEHFSEINI